MVSHAVSTTAAWGLLWVAVCPECGRQRLQARNPAFSAWEGAAVDFGGYHGVDEGVGCDVAVGDGLPPFGVGDGMVGA
jgi:hypothetical protein